jgi:hypothetical protein
LIVLFSTSGQKQALSFDHRNRSISPYGPKYSPAKAKNEILSGAYGAVLDTDKRISQSNSHQLISPSKRRFTLKSRDLSTLQPPPQGYEYFEEPIEEEEDDHPSNRPRKMSKIT